MLQTDGADATTARPGALAPVTDRRGPSSWAWAAGPSSPPSSCPEEPAEEAAPGVVLVHPSLVSVRRAEVESFAAVELGHANGHSGQRYPAFLSLESLLGEVVSLGLVLRLDGVHLLLRVPFMKPLTLARRLLTSPSRFPPLRRLRRISCCCSYIGSRPSTSLLLSNHPARTTRFEARGFEVATGSRRSDRRSATARR